MVTFYRKAQIKSSSDNQVFDGTLNQSSGGWNEPKYLGVINPEDDLPYVTIRPKTNRKNHKKILRMRSYWD